MKHINNFIDLKNINQTDGKISSKASLISSYVLLVSLLTILISTIGYLPFFCTYTKIKSFICIFLLLIILIHVYSIIKSEKSFKIFINKRKLIIFFLISFLVILLGFASSFLIIKYETAYETNSIEINYVTSFILLSIILIPYITIMFTKIISPLVKASDAITKQYHKEHDSL